VRHSDGESELDGSKAELHDVGEIVLHDWYNRTMITLSTTSPATLWIFPVFTITEQYGKKVWIYQHTSLMFCWKTSISEGHSFATSLGLRIEKK
jgi:hypothetical protein